MKLNNNEIEVNKNKVNKGLCYSKFLIIKIFNFGINQCLYLENIFFKFVWLKRRLHIRRIRLQTKQIFRKFQKLRKIKNIKEF